MARIPILRPRKGRKGQAAFLFVLAQKGPTTAKFIRTPYRQRIENVPRNHMAHSPRLLCLAAWQYMKHALAIAAIDKLAIARASNAAKRQEKAA